MKAQEWLESIAEKVRDLRREGYDWEKVVSEMKDEGLSQHEISCAISYAKENSYV